MPVLFYFLLSAAAVAILAIVFLYARWEDRDDRRRSDRLVQRNIQRMCGR